MERVRISIASLVLVGLCCVVGVFTINDDVMYPEVGDVDRDEYDCSVSHRAHPTDVRKYQTLANDVWVDMTCAGPDLVWDETACRCEYPYTPDLTENCISRQVGAASESRYERFIDGQWQTVQCGGDESTRGTVWNERACGCVKSIRQDQDGDIECDVMLNVSFGQPIRDTAKGSFVGISPGSRVNVTMVDGAIGGWAAVVEHAAFKVYYFAGNVWSERVQVFLSFRADVPDRGEHFQSLVTNACPEMLTGSVHATISLSYRPKDGTVRLTMTTMVTGSVDCRVQDPMAWHSVAVLYHEDGLQIVVDGISCANSTHFVGPVATNQCPLTIASDPLGKDRSFKGILDEVLITRYCRMV